MDPRVALRPIATTLELVLTTSRAYATGKNDRADTARMAVATTIVLTMTLPGLTLFYAGIS